MPVRQEYDDTITVLRAAQAYADELEPRIGERIDSDRISAGPPRGNLYKCYKPRPIGLPGSWRIPVRVSRSEATCDVIVSIILYGLSL